MNIAIAPEFGYCVLVFLASIFVLMWMSGQVMKARKKYEVKYPDMYSDREPMFNCVQRVHQNTLEGYSMFCMLLLFGGLQHPCVSAVGGAIFLAGKVAYALGYYSGDPEKRMRGAFGYIGLLMLLLSTLSFALHTLQWL